MDPVLKKLLNNLSCPICKGPIDIISSTVSGYRNYNYGCAASLDHYVILIVSNFNNLGLPKLTIETVNVYDKNRKYQLTKRFDRISSSFNTEILILKTDLEGRVEFSFKNTSLILDKELFDFSKFNADKAVNRIKTIFTFQ